MPRSALLSLLFCACLASSHADAAASITRWPLTLPASGATLEVHEPIVDGWNDGIVTARCLVLARTSDVNAPAQGSAVIQAAGQVDSASGVVTLLDPQVLDVRFQVQGAEAADWGGIIRTMLPGAMRTFSLTRLQAGQAAAQARQRGAAAAAAPEESPRILVSETPAVLVYIDGPPRFVAVPATALSGAINTKVLLVRDGQGTWYLHLYDGWVSASSLEGPWSIAAAPSGSGPLERAAVEGGKWNLLPGKRDAQGRLPALAGGLPKIIVAQAPAALIVLDGPPRVAAVPGSGLRYAVNTSAHLFLDPDGLYYVRVGGAWYRSSRLDRQWVQVPAAALPADFARLPDDGPKAGVGDAVARAQAGAPAPLGQSRVVAADPATTQLTVLYSDDPVLKPIPGTQLNYAANASVPVIQVDIDRWYAIENGVWFRSSSATGPWSVTSAVPDEIYAIPPTVPIYHAIHSRVLSASNDVVYYDYPGGGGPNYASRGGAMGVEDQGDDYQYTPPAGMYWSHNY
jgi:hypothetical protein